MDVYNELLDEESGNLKANVDTHEPVVVEGEALSRSSLNAINASDKIISFANQVRHHGHLRRHERDRYFQFDVSQVPLDDQVISAELRVYRDTAFDVYPSNWTYHLQLYQVVQNAKK